MQVYNIFVFSEADPLVGWNRDRWWRADVTYASMAAKVENSGY